MQPTTEHEWTIHALNIHGAFFERWAAATFAKQPGWRIRATGYPVRMPPDPRMNGKESAVDVVVQTLRGKVLLTLVVECKKNNAEFVNWIFFRSHVYPQLTLPALAHGELRKDEPPDWFVVRRLIASSLRVTDEARETRGNYAEHKKGETKTRTANAAISEAAYQAALGLQALLWEERHRARTVDASERDWGPREWRDHVFLPVVLTTANLKVAAFDPQAVDAATGEIQYDDVTLEDVHLQTDDIKIEQLPTEDSANLWTRLHMVVVNSRSVGDFLTSELIREIVGRDAA